MLGRAASGATRAARPCTIRNRDGETEAARAGRRAARQRAGAQPLTEKLEFGLTSRRRE